MNLNLLIPFVAFLVGAGLGLVYFGGLWLTLQNLPKPPQLIPWMLGSLLLRFAIALGCIYLLINYFAGEQMFLSLLTFSLGFLLIRNLLINRLRPQ